MYFFTNYQLTGIQTGIQAGHAALEYARTFGDYEEFQDFVDNHKTWIILNGGTTNSNLDLNGNPYGSLNMIAKQLHDNHIRFSVFNEPDLENALTAVCFIADERVFDKETYPEYRDFLYTLMIDEPDNVFEVQEIIETFKRREPVDKNHRFYLRWLDLIGGPQNEFLRELLNGKKLA